MWQQLESVIQPITQGRLATEVDLLVAFVAAVLLSAGMAYVYRLASAEDYNADIAQSQILLACIMAVVMLVVGDNLSRAFGAVGILSVIRFRAKIKTSHEAATLLASVAIGMACGVGLYRVAIAGALLMCLLFLFVGRVFSLHDKTSPQPSGQTGPLSA